MISLNLKRAIWAAEVARQENNLDEISEELLLWGLMAVQCASFYWLRERCGCVELKRFLVDYLSEEFIEPKIPDDILEVPYDLCPSIEIDFKKAEELLEDLDDNEVTPEYYLYAALFREDSSVKSLFVDNSDLGEDCGQVFINYIKSESDRSGKETGHIEDVVRQELIKGGLVDPNSVAQGGEVDSYLDKYCRNLTLDAANGLITPAIGRDKEVEAATTMLCRKEKNNPVFVGPSGTGKSKIVEHLALMFTKEYCNILLKNKQIFELKMASLVSDATLRGQFEERLEGCLKEACERDDVILFIDELHTIVGAGSAGQEQLDASNMLKPYLARGDLWLIGATTMDEYRVHIQKDKALDRRFQKVLVQEPSKKECQDILEGIIQNYEYHHGVSCPRNLLKKIVDLSDKFVPNKQFPDKAIDVLDETFAFVKARHFRYPESFKNVLETEIEDEDAEPSEEFAKLAEECGNDLKEWEEKVVEIPTIKEDDIYDLFFQKFNISKVLLNRQAEDGVLSLKGRLDECTFGQEKAVEQICQTVKMKHIGLTPSDDGSMFSFVFNGEGGSGKEFVARKFSSLLFSGKDTFHYFNCDSFSHNNVLDSMNEGVFCTLYFDNFDPKNEAWQKYFETMISEGHVLNDNGAKVWCKHCNVILATTKAESQGDIGFNPDKKEKKAPIKPLAPYVDKEIFFKVVGEDVLYTVALARAKKTIKGIVDKIENVEVDFTEVELESFIKRELGDDVTLDTLDSKLSQILSEKLCDDLIEISIKGGTLNIDKILNKEQ